MTREKALEALRVYCEWQYDTTMELWSAHSREGYMDIAMRGLQKLDDKTLSAIGKDAVKRMQNPVGMLVQQLREMQSA